MELKSTAQIAKHLREVYVGKNWTWADLREHISDVTWEQATRKVFGLNTIATLVFHQHHFVKVLLKVLRGGQIEESDKDKYSFDHPPFESQADWDNYLEKVFADTEALAQIIEQLPDEKLWETFVEEKYGIVFRNLLGVIEHTHYHLGQIVLIKKLVLIDSAK